MYIYYDFWSSLKTYFKLIVRLSEPPLVGPLLVGASGCDVLASYDRAVMNVRHLLILSNSSVHHTETTYKT